MGYVSGSWWSAASVSFDLMWLAPLWSLNEESALSVVGLHFGSWESSVDVWSKVAGDSTEVCGIAGEVACDEVIPAWSADVACLDVVDCT